MFIRRASGINKIRIKQIRWTATVEQFGDEV